MILRICQVHDEWYSQHYKRGAPANAPRTMRVDYLIGRGRCQSEWICFEHAGYARRKAEEWWRARTTLPVPATVDEAVRLANEGVLVSTRLISVLHDSDERYGRIVDYKLDAPPPRESGLEAPSPFVATEADLEDVPF